MKTVSSIKLSIFALAACLFLFPVTALAQGRGPTPRGPRPPQSRYERGPARPGSPQGFYGPRDWYFGLDAGLALPSVVSNNQYLNAPAMDSGTFFGIAVATQAMPMSPVCVQTGLYWVEKGGKDRGGDWSVDLNYLEVPFLVKYRGVFGMGLIQPYAGFYFAQGVGGKRRDYVYRTATPAFGEYYRRFDSGLRMGLSAQLSFVSCEVGYDLGFANIGWDDFDRTRNRCLFLSVGLTF